MSEDKRTPQVGDVWRAVSDIVPTEYTDYRVGPHGRYEMLCSNVVWVGYGNPRIGHPFPGGHWVLISSADAPPAPAPADWRSEFPIGSECEVDAGKWALGALNLSRWVRCRVLSDAEWKARTGASALSEHLCVEWQDMSGTRHGQSSDPTHFRRVCGESGKEAPAAPPGPSCPHCTTLLRAATTPGAEGLLRCSHCSWLGTAERAAAKAVATATALPKCPCCEKPVSRSPYGGYRCACGWAGGDALAEAGRASRRKAHRFAVGQWVVVSGYVGLAQIVACGWTVAGACNYVVAFETPRVPLAHWIRDESYLTGCP